MRNALLFVFMLFGAAQCFGADAYPNKLVRVIVSYPPGGTTDLVARVISRQLSEQLGQSFIVENRPGGGSTIGAAFVAKAAPDGYTLLMGDMSFSIVPSLYNSLPYNDTKDFTPITQVIGVPEVLVVNTSVKANTLKDFIALAQANPGKFNYGSAGVGTAIHLSGELFKIVAKVNLVHIAYKGGGEMAMAGISGQVQMLFGAIPTLFAQVKSGRLRPLAVTTSGGKRSPILPDVPSMSEAGVPGMEIYVWFGLIGPAGMPKDVVNKLRAEVVKALAASSVKEQFAAQGAEMVGSSPEEFSKLIRTDRQRWAEVVKSAGITPE